MRGPSADVRRRYRPTKIRVVVGVMVCVGIVAMDRISSVLGMRGANPEPFDSAIAYMRLEDHMRTLGPLMGPQERLFDIPGMEMILRASCATGPFNGNEEWVAYRETATVEIWYRYRKNDQSITQLHAPCAVFLQPVQEFLQRKERLTRPVVEIFDDDFGNYVPAADGGQLHEPSSTLLQSSVSSSSFLGKFGGDAQKAEDAATEQYQLIENGLRSFVSPLDELLQDATGGNSSEFPLATEEFVTTTINQSDPNHHEFTIADARRIFAQVLTEEQELLKSASTNTSTVETLSFREWELLRNGSVVEERKPLARHWTTLASIVLVTTKNATTSMDCLRRAVSWYPGHVPAYLALSSILQHYDHQNASCQIMEKMLEKIDPSEFRSGEMRTILTTHFPHCSVIISMANLWENNVVVRYIVGASVVISFLHGLFVAVYFCQDRIRECWSIRKGDTSSKTTQDGSTMAAVKPQQQHTQSHSQKKGKRD